MRESGFEVERCAAGAMLFIIAGFGAGCESDLHAPLGGGYQLWEFGRRDQFVICAPTGVVLIPSNSGSNPCQTVSRLAASGDYIVGECTDRSTGSSMGFFVVKTTAYGLKYGLSEPEWDLALRERGIPPDIELQNVHAFAMSRSEQDAK